jgi:hypothetical protein
MSGECMSTGTSTYVNNSLFISSTSFPFCKKEIFSWEHIKSRELAQHNSLAFFCWGEIPQNMYVLPNFLL